jgi:hypothetical protein
VGHPDHLLHFGEDPCPLLVGLAEDFRRLLSAAAEALGYLANLLGRLPGTFMLLPQGLSYLPGRFRILPQGLPRLPGVLRFFPTPFCLRTCHFGLLTLYFPTLEPWLIRVHGVLLSRGIGVWTLKSA